MTDSELRQLMSTDPAQGHRALYDQYADYVYAIIVRHLGSTGTREDAEDCLVETFTEIIRRADCITGDSLKSYIGTAARNRALSCREQLARRSRQQVPLDTVTEPSVQHVQEEMERKALSARLMEEIRKLGEPDATIIIQKYYYDQKMTAIAKLVGLSPNTAQVRCGRALKHLRKALADWR